jgi:hypothetical protein
MITGETMGNKEKIQPYKDYDFVNHFCMRNKSKLNDVFFIAKQLRKMQEQVYYRNRKWKGYRKI